MWRMYAFKGPVTVIEGGAGAWLQRLADLKMDALKAWGAHQMQCVKVWLRAHM
jgi:hypothetical protein